MDDLSDLSDRAKSLRARLSAYLDDFGELRSGQRQLLGELAEIEEHLKALGAEGGYDSASEP